MSDERVRSVAELLRDAMTGGEPPTWAVHDLDYENAAHKVLAFTDKQCESELAALRAANAEMREALVAMMEGSHWKEEHDYEGLRMPANWHTIRMPSSEALDKARAALNR